MAFIRQYRRKGRIYLAEVENQWEDGKVRQKFIRYIGVAPDSERSAFPTCNQELSLDGVKLYGSIVALDSAAKLLDLHELLGEHFAPILSLVYSHCHDYKGVKDMKHWFKSVNLSKVFGVDEISEKALHQGILAIEEMDILSIEKSIFEKMKKKFKDSSEGVVYDVTNTYLRGAATTAGSELARKGKDKQGVRGRRLIQVGLGMTDEMRLPIFHQVYPGNTSDSKMFQEGIEHLNRLNIKAGTIVYDRGMHAKSSILRLANTNWKIVGGVPIHKKLKDFISNLDFEKFENVRYRLEQGVSTFYARSYPYEFEKVKGRLIIILNPKKRFDLKERRIHELLTAKKSGKKMPEHLLKFLNINGKINSHAIKREELLDGVSALFVTGKVSIKRAIKVYFEKDLIEKSFMTLKSVLKLRPIRHWLDGKVKGHLFICYLSLVLLTTIRCLAHQKGLSSLKGLSIEKIMKELKSVYIIEYSNNKNTKSPKKQYQKVVALSKLQKDIFSAIVPEFNS